MELLTFPSKPKTNDFKMIVPFNDQNDNSSDKGQGPGWRHCFATSCAMLAKYYKPSLWSEYKDFANGYLDVLRPFGDTTESAPHVKALATLGIDVYFTNTASIQDVTDCLYQGSPVPIGTRYKVGGHWIILIGRRDGFFTAHNPYGARQGTSDQWIEIGNNSGKDEVLSAAWMESCFTDLGPEEGYAIITRSVDGKPTGCKDNL